MCASIWGSNYVGYSYSPSIEASWGSLTLRDCSEMEEVFSMSTDYALIVHGRFIKNGKDFSLINVYAPYDSGCKHVLWNNLSGL